MRRAANGGMWQDVATYMTFWQILTADPGFTSIEYLLNTVNLSYGRNKYLIRNDAFVSVHPLWPISQPYTSICLRTFSSDHRSD